MTTVTTKQDQATLDDGAMVTTVLYDGIERKTDTERFLNACAIHVQQTYEAEGRPYTVSLPYNTCTETKHVQTTTYDAADRPVSVATDDGAATVTTYNGKQATVTDASGATRAVTTDGLGRISSVAEEPSGNNYLISYTYNSLDNLMSVTQGARAATSVQL